MEYKEYGSKNNDIIILLHGGGLSWWNYIDEISLLENEFHIVIPILDGHSGSDTNFTSIESNALEIINFINKIPICKKVMKPILLPLMMIQLICSRKEQSEPFRNISMRCLAAR